jgi:hypothetical protein
MYGLLSNMVLKYLKINHLYIYLFCSFSYKKKKFKKKIFEIIFYIKIEFNEKDFKSIHLINDE